MQPIQSSITDEDSTSSVENRPDLQHWHFDNRFAALGAPWCTRVSPTPLPDVQLAAFSPEAGRLVDLAPAITENPQFAEIMAGNVVLPGMEPVASVYAGHQFGNYVPRLGDGRALLLGSVRNHAGKLWEIQLKGCGRTPYSRFGDGRAVLRSTVREYLVSEAMHGLGVPTTRALCIATSPQRVMRETPETAAVLCRLAPSHVRFGSFEYFHHSGQDQALAPLADHVIDAHYPDLSGCADRYTAWLEAVIERTARLMAHWQAVGFVHGVMNTDNFSVLGLTLDYGPWAFFDHFDPRQIFNHTDAGGRYTWERQPQVGYWNVARLLEACLPLLGDTPEAGLEAANALLERYPPACTVALAGHWRDKLGLQQQREGDEHLMQGWLRVLGSSGADFSRSFRGLAEVDSAADAAPPAIRAEITDLDAFDAWLVDYKSRLRGEAGDSAERRRRMNAANPRFILRSHLAQHAIEKAQAGDFGEVETLRRILAHPFDEQPGHDAYAAAPPPDADRVNLSCSS